MNAKIKFGIEADKKWISNNTKELKLIENTTGNYIGKISSKNGSENYLKIIIHTNNKYYKIQISGNLNSWYSDDFNKDFTRPMFVNCIKLLAKILSIKKSILMNAKIDSVLFESRILIQKKIVDIKRIDLLSNFITQNAEYKLVLEKKQTQNYISLTLKINCDFENDEFGRYEIDKVKDVILAWNIIVKFWEEQIIFLIKEFTKNHILSEVFCEPIINCILQKSKKLKDKMGYKEEMKCHYIGNPSDEEVENFINQKNKAGLEICGDIFNDTLEICKHPKTIKKLNSIIQRIDENYKLIT